MDVRIARGLNRLWKRTGRVFADRYHAHVIRSPREMRNVLRYVLCNGRKHGAHTAPGPDPLSSGPAYQDWSDVLPELAIPDPRVVEPTSWLLAHCMPAKYPLIATDEVPPHAASPRAFATHRKAERSRRRAS